MSLPCLVSWIRHLSSYNCVVFSNISICIFQYQYMSLWLHPINLVLMVRKETLTNVRVHYITIEFCSSQILYKGSSALVCLLTHLESPLLPFSFTYNCETSWTVTTAESFGHSICEFNLQWRIVNRTIGLNMFNVDTRAGFAHIWHFKSEFWSHRTR